MQWSVVHETSVDLLASQGVDADTDTSDKVGDRSRHRMKTTLIHAKKICWALSANMKAS